MQQQQRSVNAATVATVDITLQSRKKGKAQGKQIRHISVLARRLSPPLGSFLAVYWQLCEPVPLPVSFLASTSFLLSFLRAIWHRAARMYNRFPIFPFRFCCSLRVFTYFDSCVLLACDVFLRAQRPAYSQPESKLFFRCTMFSVSYHSVTKYNERL